MVKEIPIYLDFDIDNQIGMATIDTELMPKDLKYYHIALGYRLFYDAKSKEHSEIECLGLVASKAHPK